MMWITIKPSRKDKSIVLVKGECVMDRMIIANRQFDEERALYNLTNGDVSHCVFAGPADGESALKEARDRLSHRSV